MFRYSPSKAWITKLKATNADTSTSHDDIGKQQENRMITKTTTITGIAATIEKCNIDNGQYGNKNNTKTNNNTLNCNYD